MVGQMFFLLFILTIRVPIFTKQRYSQTVLNTVNNCQTVEEDELEFFYTFIEFINIFLTAINDSSKY